MSDVNRFATRGSARTDQGRSGPPGQNGGASGPSGQNGPGSQPGGGPQVRNRPPSQQYGNGNGSGSTQTMRAPSQQGMTSPATRPTASRQSAPRSRAPRRAHLLLSRLDPWSVMKFSFVVSLVLFVVLFVAVAVLYSVLAGMGVFDAVVSTARDLSGGNNGWDVADWFSAKTILGWTAVLGAVNVVLVTALATLGAFVYNLVTSLVGGIEVTLSEAE